MSSYSDFVSGGGAVDLFTLSKTFTTGELLDISLSVATTTAIVYATKKNTFPSQGKNINFTKFFTNSDYYSEKLNSTTTITPDTISGKVTFTFASGDFTTLGDVLGWKFIGNGGVGIIISATEVQLYTNNDLSDLSDITTWDIYAFEDKDDRFAVPVTEGSSSTPTYTPISTSSGVLTEVNKLIELDNGTIFTIYSTQYYKIINKDGTEVLAQVDMSDETTAIKLNNGNIFMLSGVDASNGYGYIRIIDQSGNIIKADTEIATSALYELSITQLNNNNVVLGYYNDNQGNYYFQIFDNAGNSVLSETATHTNLGFIAMAISTGDFLCAGADGSFIDKYTPAGAYSSSSPALTTINSLNLIYIKLNGDNVVYCWVDKDTSYASYRINDNAGAVIKSATSLGASTSGNTGEINFNSLANGDIIFFYYNDNTNYDILYTRTDNTGTNIISSGTVKTISTGTYLSYYASLLANGNTFLANDKFYEISTSGGVASKNYLTLNKYITIIKKLTLDSAITNLLSLIPSEVKNGADISYCFNTKNGSELVILKHGQGLRKIVKFGTPYQYNSDTTYSAETWVNGDNDINLTFKMALNNNTTNLLTLSDLNSLDQTDLSLLSAGGEQFFIGVGLSVNSDTDAPYVTKFVYTGQEEQQGLAIGGADYTYHKINDTSLSFEALVGGDYEIRVI